MDKLIIYTLYDHPIDYPEEYVVRGFEIINSPDPIPQFNLFLRSKDLDFIYREMAKTGLVIIPRSPNDKPNIICSWI